ncbi:Cse1-domain-containing protein [Suhomyces tanzawaensis NRRL Y-17324]|uniref:Cse1-domain-containing protein n=1 Tax=Suhomyces tanzawaensis NRRL Y-17324 TaxID=984487 RepID=A0A1E4SDG8_9ASCO|nr:Cse1-domain-containing protein [Suhomyces tanzawaensis NRRL Y-17324]ODV77545.1 Cse1-domain-containing protein [Suhomyces tanzawaensis NRRL Y-17324]
MAENSLEAIPNYLEQSLSPQFAKQAEAQLKSIEGQNGFSINLLHVISSTNLPVSVRLAGALFFKNLIKRKWTNDDGDYLLPLEDVEKIKGEILDVMIKLPNQLQIQIGEAITLIAESDFPHRWTNLIETLVAKLSLDDFVSNKAILLVSHSIFKKWRPLFRSDELFLEIKMVLDQFVEPFMKLFVELDQLIEKNSDNQALLNIYFENLLLLIQIYYDFNCQDIPEFFEDNMVVLMNIVHKYLIYTDKGSDDDEEITVPIKLKTSIIELVSLYITRYADVFEPLIQNFITSVWSLITDYVTSQPKFDLLVVKALQFLTSIVKVQTYHSLFNNESSINEIIEKIILPNIYFREVDEELFEDEPINFVRLDLEGSDFDSRRKSATDFLKELKEINSELLTNSVMKYVNKFLSISGDNWKNKDTAIYLFSSLATKGNITSQGVTSTNVLVDVVQFFSENIAQDLLNESSHPILKVDSIKYILNFRNQLTKDQLLATIPLLVKHLSTGANPVVYTYSAITIEKLLEMTNFNDNHQLIFTKQDIKPFSTEILTNLFNLILLNDQSPEKLSENEFLMKGVVRILNTIENDLQERLPIIKQLLRILKITAKNPANPKFSHYTFEAIGLLIKFGLNELDAFIELVIPALLDILGEDVQEFVPYTFQVLAYLLENYPKGSGLPPAYHNLIKPLLSPSVWEFKGNIPGITRLLVSIVEHDPSVFTSNLTPLLGVFQKLISSRINDGYGFDLLLSILLNIPLNSLTNYLRDIATLILTRLKTSRTDKFLKRFVVFISTLNSLSLNQENAQYTNGSILDGDFVIGLIDSVQAGVFQQLFTNLILPTLQGFINLQDKKIGNLGISQFLGSQGFNGNYSSLLVPTILQLVKNLNGYDGIIKSVSLSSNNSGALNELDLETSSFGSNFSKIVSIQNKPFDPLSNVKNTDYVGIKSVILQNVKKVDVRVLNELGEDVQMGLKNLGLA